MATGERKDVTMNQLKLVRGTQTVSAINHIHGTKSGRSTQATARNRRTLK